MVSLTDGTRSADRTAAGGAAAKPSAANRSLTHTPTPRSKAGNGVCASTSSALPLSGRRADPLDLTTVERKGRPLAGSIAKSARSHIDGVREAPTFRPTEEEFRNPMEYMRKIATQGRKYGIVKIVPPESWNPDFAIDTKVWRSCCKIS